MKTDFHNKDFTLTLAEAELNSEMAYFDLILLEFLPFYLNFLFRLGMKIC